MCTPTALVFAVLALTPAPVLAQRTSYEGVLLGERAAGMGGAFIAIADDSSATVHNPAGLAQVRTRGLSLSANTYTYASETVHGVLSGYGEEASMHATAVMTFPNATAYVLPLGGGDGWDHTAAVSLAVPYGLSFEGHQRLGFRAIYFDIDLFRSVEERVYLVGPSYGLRVGRLYVGASAFLQYVSSSDTEQLALTLSDGATFTYRQESFTSTSSDYYGLTGIVGVLLRLDDHWSIGARVRLPNLRLAGTARTYHSVVGSRVEVDEATMSTTTALYQDAYREVESDTDYQYPLSFGLGVGYTIPGVLRVALDVTPHLPLDPYTTLDGEVQPYDPDQPGDLPGLEDERGFDPRVVDPGRRMVVNAALGADVHLGGDFSVLAGAFTDFSAVPDDGYDESEQVDSFGGSLAVRRDHAGTSLTVGVIGRYGEGRAVGLALDETGFSEPDVDVTLWSLTLFIAGSSTLGDDGEQEDEVREPARSRPEPAGEPAPPPPAAAPAPAPSTTPAPLP